MGISFYLILMEFFFQLAEFERREESSERVVAFDGAEFEIANPRS